MASYRVAEKLNCWILGDSIATRICVSPKDKPAAHLEVRLEEDARGRIRRMLTTKGDGGGDEDYGMKRLSEATELLIW
ncbi:MAG: hypothetical protein K2K75_11625 [Muribaculaceae bacterium]|nr:hypothetical protein [Muribaculaceae bacterium]